MEVYQNKNQSIYRSLIKEIKKKNKYTNLYLATLCDLSEAYISDFIRGNRELNLKAINKILNDCDSRFDNSNETYYNAQKEEHFPISATAINEEYITKRSEYADKLIEISNYIITYDLIKEIENGRN